MVLVTNIAVVDKSNVLSQQLVHAPSSVLAETCEAEVEGELGPLELFVLWHLGRPSIRDDRWNITMRM